MRPTSQTKLSGVTKPVWEKWMLEMVPKNQALRNPKNKCNILENTSKKLCAKYKYIKARILASSKSSERIKFPLLPKTMIDFIDDEDDEEVNGRIYNLLKVQPRKITEFSNKDERTLNQAGNSIENSEQLTPTIKIEQIPRSVMSKSTPSVKREVTGEEKPFFPENTSMPIKASCSSNAVQTEKSFICSSSDSFSLPIANYKPVPSHSCCITLVKKVQGESQLSLVCNVCHTQLMFEFEPEQNNTGQTCCLQDISKCVHKGASLLLKAVQSKPLLSTQRESRFFTSVRQNSQAFPSSSEQLTRETCFNSKPTHTNRNLKSKASAATQFPLSPASANLLMHNVQRPLDQKNNVCFQQGNMPLPMPSDLNYMTDATFQHSTQHLGHLHKYSKLSSVGASGTCLSAILPKESSGEQLQPNMHMKCSCHLDFCFNRPKTDAHPTTFTKEPVFVFKGWKDERIVGLYGTNRTILIKNIDRKRKWDHAVDIVNCTDKALNFPKKNKKPDQIYLVVNDNKVIGVVACVCIKEAYRVLDMKVCSQETYPAKCGISSLWVDRGFRRRGIASQVLETVRRNYKSDVVLTRDQIAFSVITTDGKQFAEKYCRRKDYLVYLSC